MDQRPDHRHEVRTLHVHRHAHASHSEGGGEHGHGLDWMKTQNCVPDNILRSKLLGLTITGSASDYNPIRCEGLGWMTRETNGCHIEPADSSVQYDLHFNLPDNFVQCHVPGTLGLYIDHVQVPISAVDIWASNKAVDWNRAVKRDRELIAKGLEPGISEHEGLCQSQLLPASPRTGRWRSSSVTACTSQTQNCLVTSKPSTWPRVTRY